MNNLEDSFKAFVVPLAMDYEGIIEKLKKEIRTLRLILKSHGDIIEENAKLRAKIKELEQ